MIQLFAIAVTLLWTSQERSASPPSILKPGAELEGALTETTKVVEFALEVTDSGPVTIDLHGPFFDGYLRLLDAEGAVIAEDDNGWMHRHPRLIVEVLPDTSLRVEVSAVKGRVGPFVIACHAGRADAVPPAAAIEDAIRCYEECKEALGEDSLVTAWRSRIVGMGMAVESPDESQQWFRRTLAIRERVLGPDHRDVAQSLYNIAIMKRGRGGERERLLRRALAILDSADPEGDLTAAVVNGLSYQLELSNAVEAEELLHRGLSIREALWGREHAEVGDSLMRLANVTNQQGRYAEAEDYYRRTLAVLQKTLGGEHSRVADALNGLGNVLEEQGQYAEAEGCHRQALTMRKALFGVRHNDTAQSFHNLGFVLSAQKRYAEAEEHYRLAASVHAEVIGSEHQNTASSYHSLGMVLFHQSRHSEAEGAFRQAASIREVVLGEHADTAQSTHNLGLVLKNQDRYSEAEEAYLRALSIRERVLGEEHLDTVYTLSDLGSVLRSQKRYPESLHYYRRALASREKLFGEQHEDTATSVNALGYVLLLQRRNAEAEVSLRRALSIREQVLGEQHAGTAYTLSNLGLVIERQGRYAEAEGFHRRAMSIREQVVGEMHKDTAYSINRVGVMLERQGQDAEAEALYRRALAIREQVLGEQHEDTLQSFRNVAITLVNQQRYSEAEAYYRRALETRAPLHGEARPFVAVMTQGMADVFEAQGRYAEAESYRRRALSIREELHGELHIETSSALMNLATQLSEQKRHWDAEPFYRRAVAIREELLGVADSRTASAYFGLGWALGFSRRYEEGSRFLRASLEHGSRRRRGKVTLALGVICEYQGRFEEAERLHRESLEASVEESGSLNLRWIWNNIGTALAGQGRFEESEEAYRRALDMVERTVGGDRLDLFEFRADLALLMHRMGRADEAVELAEQAAEQALVRTAREASFTPAELRFGLMTQLRRAVSLLATLCVERGEVSDLHEMLASAKGLSFRLSSRAGVETAGTPRSLELRRRAIELTARMSALTYVDRIEDEETHRARFESLQDQRRGVERELLAELGVRPERLRTNASELGRLLPEGTALVDVVEHRPYRLSEVHSDTEEFEDEASARLLAWVIRSGATEATFVDLGSSSRMKTLVEDGLRALAPGLRASTPELANEDGRDALTALREALFDPLAPHLSGVRRLVVSPDGVLSELPFEALPTGSGRCLLELAEVVYVQDAVTLRDRLESEAPARTSSPSMLALGGIDYDARSVGEPTTDASSTRGERAFSTAWSSLPETALEAQLLADKLPDSATVLTGDAATEEAVKASAPGKSILHLATHGFYQRRGLTSLWAAAKEAAQEEAGLDLMPIGIGGTGVTEGEDEAEDETGYRRPAFEHLDGVSPGLLTGVVLAGVNQPPVSGHDDGVLTGDEVSRLDLSACDLAVLSACETALGQSSPGEGVMSLRRSFREAGAKTVISTLWRVDDRATRELMTQFYTRLLDRKQAPGQALRGAKLHLLNNTEFEDPSYWAAFTLAGDWR